MITIYNYKLVHTLTKLVKINGLKHSYNLKK